MLRFIRYQFKVKAEEQADFRQGRSTVEQIFNSRVITEKCPQHRRDLLHNFTDFKKAFDRVWHAGLCQFFRSFSTAEWPIQAIQALGGNSRNTVLLNCQLGEFFKTTAGILLPFLFNLFPDHAGNTPRPPYCWWQAQMQPTVRRDIDGR